MSLYDDASLIFLGQAAAGGIKDKLPTLKPVEKLRKELVTNNGFDIDVDWTKSADGISITGGEAVYDGSEDIVDLYQPVGSLSGKTIKVSFTIRDYEAGTIGGMFHMSDGPSTSQVKGNGKHSIIHAVGTGHNGNTGLRSYSYFKGKIDNISIREVEQEAVDFTYSRSTDIGATRVGHDGFIKKVRQNLLTYSNTFTNSIWGGSGTWTGGQAGWDTKSEAYTLTKSGANDSDYYNDSFDGLQTFSIYAKKQSGAGLGIYHLLDEGSGNWRKSIINLNDGTQQYSGGDLALHTEVEDLAPAANWWRISVTINRGAGKWYLYTTDGTDTQSVQTVTLQYAQLEKGMVATPYIDNLGEARVIGPSAGQPRYDYYDTTEPRHLQEPRRTNLVKITEGVPEAKNNVTLTYNYGVSPEGRKNSLKVQKGGGEGGANDRIRVMDASAITLVSGKKYTISAFVKNIDCVGTTTLACRVAGQTNFRQGFGWASGSAGADIAVDDDHGGNGTRTNKFAKDYGDGWWRIGFTFTADGTAGSFEIDVDRDEDSDDDTTSIETWGWQLEQTITTNSTVHGAPYVTSYIPNFGASAGATRVGDFMRVQDMKENGLIDQEQGTVFVDYDQWCTTAVHWDLRGNDGAVVYSLRMHASAVDKFQFQYKNPDDGQRHIRTFTSLTGTRRKGAMSWNGDKLIISCNGNSFTTSIPPNIALNINRFQRSNNTSTMASPRSILIFDKQLSESELNDLTTI